MASWILVPCLVGLRTEFNTLSPGRDKASDGSIGDDAHRESTSDHNVDDGPDQGATPSEDADSAPEVHAIDVDKDLRKAGWTMDRAVEVIVTRHRRGLDNRLQNVIWNRRIWSASWGWTARTYTGSNPHDKHAHFSARYTPAQESDTRHWGLLEDDDMTPDQLLDALESPRGQAALTNAVRTIHWNALHAALQDETYRAASAAEQKTMRNDRDITLNADVVGNPWNDASLPEADQNKNITIANALSNAAGARKDLAALDNKVDQVLALLAPPA